MFRKFTLIAAAVAVLALCAVAPAAATATFEKASPPSVVAPPAQLGPRAVKTEAVKPVSPISAYSTFREQVPPAPQADAVAQERLSWLVKFCRGRGLELGNLAETKLAEIRGLSDEVFTKYVETECPKQPGRVVAEKTEKKVRQPDTRLRDQPEPVTAAEIDIIRRRAAGVLGLAPNGKIPPHTLTQVRKAPRQDVKSCGRVQDPKVPGLWHERWALKHLPCDTNKQ